MLELFLGQIPEAIFFALFMIYAKGLKEKRILFTTLMVIEYVLLKQVKFFQFNIWFQVIYTFMTYLILKLLYKEKAQIIDIFTFGIASLVLTISCMLLFFIFDNTSQNFYAYMITNRIVIFLVLFIFRKKLHNIQKIYKKLWNRNDNINKKIKSATFRSINIVAFNIMFFILNICMIFIIMRNGGV